MGGLSSFLLGCNHGNTSRPFTMRKKAGANGDQRIVSETYIVCLECGKKFPYSWEEMKVLRGRLASEVEELPEKKGISLWLSRRADSLTRRDRSA